MKFTVFLYSYNHEAFIGEAADAVLNQDYNDDYEVIFSDDASTDRTFEIMKSKAEAYHGPHKLILNRNEKNLGITRHLNKIMQMGTGDWFILCAGDDVSMLNRLSIIARQISENPDILAFNSGFEQIDEKGQVHGYHGFDEVLPYVTGATGAWNRKLFDDFGPITEPTTAEDVVIPFRAMLLGKLGMLNEPTIRYRIHAGSVSSPTNLTQLQAEEHLVKIKGNLINAVNQRLKDLEKAKYQIPKEWYQSLFARHEEINETLTNQRKNIQLRIELRKASLGRRFAFLFTGKQSGNFVYRLKILLKNSSILLWGYNLIKTRHTVTKTYSVDNSISCIAYQDLLSPQYDVLIYL